VTSAGGRGGRPPGFTLIELIVVLAVVAIAMAFVMPSVGRGTETLRVRSEAKRVAALVREARLQAVSQHRTARVALDRTRNTVTLTIGDSERPHRTVELPAGMRVTVDVGGESLTFSSRGLTRETRWIVEAAGGREMAIDVHPISGRVTVGRDPESKS
jgi:prepilin-type N-terminal cleavage/methylation domain-containing protein